MCPAHERGVSLDTPTLNSENQQAGIVGDEPPKPHRTLRLTLAMRGGVSLAVWIGGVVAELDLFRRACTPTSSPGARGRSWQIHESEPGDRIERARIYADMFAATGFKTVEIDILTGASAGGLNAILYGLSQATGAVLDEVVRQTWINDGGIWELLRPSVAPSQQKRSAQRFKSLFLRRVESVLQGDDRFFDVALEALRALSFDESATRPVALRYPAAAAPPYDISIELAATLLDDIYSPGRGNRGGFTFRRTAGRLSSGYSTIPATEDSSDAALACMALAARSTSSFPGAFEPAAVHSVASDDDARGLAVNMARVFPHARTKMADAPKVFNVVDGGIFDNIPIDRAIRAIGRAPGALPGERRLIYIDPEPPSTPNQGAAPGNPEAVRLWLSVISRSRGLQQRTETAADELELLREHNDAVLRTQARLEVLASTLNQEGALAAVRTSDSYVQYRIGLDSTRIGDLLTDPWSELCQPPRRSDDFEALSTDQVLHVKDQVAIAYGTLLPGASRSWEADWKSRGDNRTWSLSVDFYALLDQVRLLIAWVRELERLVANYAVNGPTPIDAEALNSGLSELKRRLDRYLLVTTQARHCTIDAVLAAPLKATTSLAQRQAYVPNPVGAPPQSTFPTLAQNIICSLKLQANIHVTTEILDNLRNTDAGIAHEQNLYEDLNRWNPTACTGELAYLALGKDIDEIRVTLLEKPSQLATHMQSVVSETPWVRRWQESVFPHFYESLRDWNIAELAKLFALSGTPDTAAMVGYEEVTSDLAPSEALRTVLEPLKDAARAKHLQAWLRREPTQEQMDAIVGDTRSVMNADAKLAGNDLSRFGGFFLARWRENDWQWGRLDAASGITQILIKSSGSTIEPHLGELQNSILAGANASLEQADQNLPLRVGAETLDYIRPHYRFALASRAVPLVLRALLPIAHWSPIGLLQRFGLLLARMTIGVVAPLLADPQRVIVAAVIVIGAAGLLGEDDTNKWWCLLLPALFLVSIFRSARTEWRWHRLRERINGCQHIDQNSDPPDPWFAVYKKARSRSRIWRNVAWALGIVGLTISLWALIGRALAPNFGWAGARGSAPEPASTGQIPTATLLLALLLAGSLLMSSISRANRIRSDAFSSQAWHKSVWSNPVRSTVAAIVLVVGVWFAWLASPAPENENVGVTAGGHLAGFQPHQLAHWPASAWVVSIAAACLTVNSLWGWAQNWAVIPVAGAAVGLGYAAQKALNTFGFDERHAIFHLLPAAVWLVVVGLLVQYVPCRALAGGERNTRYGERNRPVMTGMPQQQRPVWWRRIGTTLCQ
jgi:patatin-related protein